MNTIFLLSLAIVLFAIGGFGAIFRKNFLVVLMSLELMLNATNLAIISASQTFGVMGVEGQFWALLVLIIAASEVSIGLALAVNMARLKDKVEVEEFKGLNR
ncbi:MAG: NADH-quinone oxidoreductase subunit NuoK [candidate division WOR-3 bacterium]